MSISRMSRISFLVICCAAWLAATSALAEVKPHALFCDGMVLQRDLPVPVWGTADDGEQVTVRFQGQEASATAKDGKWMVRLGKLQGGGPAEMTIQGKNTIQIKDVLVGEVWLCGGQSNMEMAVVSAADAKKVIAESADAKIRLFTVPRRGSDKPESNVVGRWSPCGPDTVGGFSAVGYFFGRDLRKALDVPVGLISSNVGGTAAEQWTSREKLESIQELKGLLENKASCKLYNAMIAPLAPYALRGAIWYQGESNAGRAYQYRVLFPAMIANWRELWGQGDFAFLCVQLAPFMPIVQEPTESAWAELREAQLLTALNFPKTGMAVITDVGDEKDIHPKQKAPVGARLALAARGIAYGEKLVYSGPVYKSLKVEGDRAVLSFDSVGDGLAAKGDTLTGFTVAGEDRKFVNAQARIDGQNVVVSSPQVAKPVAVRYGWANYPVCNLWNKDGLPATPFRTDDFPGTTANNK
ncbi:MAG: sialate O-acetylesterase [Pirellulales bacterium]